MSQVEVERFLWRIITDAQFRAKAGSALIIACYDDGIALSKEEMLLLCHIDFWQFGLISETLDDAIRRKVCERAIWKKTVSC
jgi:hypothetical protein